MDLSTATIVNTDEEAMFGPPVASDCRGLMPTMAAIVRRIDYERRVKWCERVKRGDAAIQALLRRFRGH
jgi:hypothetical protein